MALDPSYPWLPPSVTCQNASYTQTYTYASQIPQSISKDPSVEVVLGVDEAGRGPVIGPMVYGVAYCPAIYTDEMISTHGFMDSKVLTHETRVDLLQRICKAGDELQQTIGWTVCAMTARDISAGMLKTKVPYNLNAQAHDTTIQLIKNVINSGVNVRKIFVDTVGVPETYQAKLSREFPMAEVVVSKKADSIYPVVSVASICAKVTRDKIIETMANDLGSKACSIDTEEGNEATSTIALESQESVESTQDMGSGYPSDARTVKWLKAHMDPIFGWPAEAGVRYSWATVKDMLEPPSGTSRTRKKDATDVKFHWHDEDDEEEGQSTLSFDKKEGFGVTSHYGRNLTIRDF